jgi:hypothetical protein
VTNNTGRNDLLNSTKNISLYYENTKIPSGQWDDMCAEGSPTTTPCIDPWKSGRNLSIKVNNMNPQKSPKQSKVIVRYNTSSNSYILDSKDITVVP